MKQLYFVRHGLSVLGEQGLWAGSTDTPLAEEGRIQASAAGRAAHEQGMHFDYIISSPLQRAYDTAKRIADEVGYPENAIEVNHLVVERGLGELEGTPWQPEYDFTTVPNAESREHLLARAQEFYDYLQTLPDESILVVSHGAFGRALASVIHPEIPFEKQDKFENAQIVKLI